VTARSIDARTRNRALLARQLLLERVARPAVAVVEHLVGMQAQTPRSPYTALWSRIRNFDPWSLSTAIESRELVRMALMRSTIHLVSAADAMLLRPLALPVLRRELTSPTFRAPLAGVDLDELAVVARRLLDEQPRSPARLGTALAERWPDVAPRALAHAARTVLPLVQVPPRGLWDRSGVTTLACADTWLGRPVRTDATWDEVALRFLAAFGPASAADLVAWCKVPGQADVLARLRPGLTVLRDERGRELFDLPDAPRPPPSTPAPPRFLPDYDNVLLSHADRSFVFPDAARAALWSANGVLPGTVLVDGIVAARWRVVVDNDWTRLVVDPFDDDVAAFADAIRAEGMGLLRLLAPDASRTEVMLGPS
jgi:hypothetical protein